MTWRSKEVEATIAQSQELLAPVELDMDVGFFAGIAMLPSLIGMRNNPGGTLKDVVPPELYARWLVQKEKYIGHDNSIEKWRPIFRRNTQASRKARAKAQGQDHQANNRGEGTQGPRVGERSEALVTGRSRLSH
jgi:hypothetical protein